MLLSEDAAYADRAYQDGSTPRAQLPAWTGFLRKYLAERGSHGTLIEYFSPTYAQYTLNNLYLYADFSADAELKRMARQSLDLWWALWAQEQVDGVHGGSKTRTYPKVLADGTAMATTAWFYFGIGPKPVQLGPGEAGAVASPYRPPAVVADIAIDTAGRGTYDVLTRAPGLAAAPLTPGPTYHVDSTDNAVLRLAHVTPDFVMGTAMFPVLSGERWTAISTQNRWDGVVFSGGDPLARIVPAIFSEEGKKPYNGLWGVQRGATQIVRSLIGGRDDPGGQFRVWFGRPLRHVDQHGWVFVEASGYAAVRPAAGGWHWDPEDPSWMILDDPGTAVVIQAARRSDYPGLEAFMAAIQRMPLAVDRDAVTVTGLGEKTPLSLPMSPLEETRRLVPAVEMQPDFVFKSPFVNEEWGTGRVRITKGERTVVLDFGSPS